MLKARNLKNIPLARTITIFVVIILLLFLMLFSVLYFIQDNNISVRRNGLENKMLDTISYQADLLGKEFDTILSDINFLYSNYSNKILNKDNIDEISLEWARISESKKIYDQIRYIDAEGNEIIRINYNDNKVDIVPNEKLQNKADRYYFFETVGLDEGKIFISKLDLNMENGKIEMPIKPVIRYSTPVYNDEGIYRGAIVLNVIVSRIIEEYKALPKINDGEIYLLNAEGYYISNNDSSKEWGFMYDEMKDMNFVTEFNEAWNKMGENFGLIQTDKGIFAYSTIGIEDKFKINAIYTENNSIVLSDNRFIAISYTKANGSYHELVATSYIIKAGILLEKYKWYFIIEFIIAIIIAIYSYINEKAKSKVEYFSKYDSLTDTFNRRAGLDLINKSLPENTRRRSNMCIIFIDVNGLKLVNDNLGHDNGDELLIIVVDVIKNNIREDDFLIRLGGDEFVIVLKNADLIKCKIIWNRIIKDYKLINEQENRKYEISVSHDVVVLDEFNDKDVDDIIK